MAPPFRGHGGESPMARGTFRITAGRWVDSLAAAGAAPLGWRDQRETARLFLPFANSGWP
jgi:hypothetical protein